MWLLLNIIDNSAEQREKCSCKKIHFDQLLRIENILAWCGDCKHFTVFISVTHHTEEAEDNDSNYRRV